MYRERMIMNLVTMTIMKEIEADIDKRKMNERNKFGT